MQPGGKTFLPPGICSLGCMESVETSLWSIPAISSFRSLPAGILRQVSVEKNDMLLKDGDMVLMMTDGVTDALGGEQKTAQWLQEEFLPRGFANPQDAADYILQAAESACAGEKDDMTVQAGRFWKRAG